MEQKYGYTVMDGLIAVDMSVLDTSAKVRAVCSKYKIALTKTMFSHSLLLFNKGQENIYEVRKLDGCFSVVPLRSLVNQTKQDSEKILEYVRSLLVQTKLSPTTLTKMRYTVYIYLPKGTPTDLPLKFTQNTTTDVFGHALSCEHMEFEKRLSFAPDYSLTTATSSPSTTPTPAFTNTFQSPQTNAFQTTTNTFTNTFQSPANTGFSGNGFQTPQPNAFQTPANTGFNGSAFGNGFNTAPQYKSPFSSAK